MKFLSDSCYLSSAEAWQRILELYKAEPFGCYFKTTVKTVNWELLLSEKTVRQTWVVKLEDWEYRDIYALMPVLMDLPAEHIPLFTEFLEMVEKEVDWRPLAICDRFVVFEILSQDSAKRAEMDRSVERFQITNNLNYIKSKWGGWWIGAT